MKKIVISFVFVVLSISVFSQTDKWYFSISMGQSWPLGSFSKNDISNPKSGYAKKGFGLLLDATYPLNEHWGMKGVVMLNNNQIDRIKLGTMLEARMNAVSISVNGTDKNFLSSQVNSWVSNAMLFGPVYTINFEHSYWDFQVLGGMNVAYLPQQKLLYEKPSNNWYYMDRNTSSVNVAFSMMACTALRFPLSDRINLKVGVDYSLSKASIKYEQIRVTKQGETVLTEILGNGKSVIPIELLSAKIGFVYYL
jgi:hypothetical protein